MKVEGHNHLTLFISEVTGRCILIILSTTFITLLPKLDLEYFTYLYFYIELKNAAHSTTNKNICNSCQQIC